MRAVRTLGALSDRVGHAFADRHGLHPTDVQALLLITEAEAAGQPLTAGALGSRLRITSGAVTGVVDRLAAHGHLTRQQDPHDRRRVLLVQSEDGRATAWSFFGPLGDRGSTVMDDFDDAELAVVERFLDGMADALQRHLADLAGDGATTTDGHDRGGRRGSRP